MAWETLRYDKFQINAAGRVLINPDSTDEQKDAAMMVLDNWRASHSYPMHVFQMTLRDKARNVDSNSLTAQRLKRVPAIIHKLKRRYHGHRPSMKLYQIQDIAGCRAVLPNIILAQKLCNDYYLKGSLKHKRVGFKDYIAEPKEDGYRSIHIIYEYKSDKNKQEFNGLRVEVQIRSKLQHLWATAIETVDFFTRQAIKSSEGEKEWVDFFRLVSSAFAKLEGCPCVPNTPDDETELYSQINKMEKELNVMAKMAGWSSAMMFFNEKIKTKNKTKNVQFFLLELDIVGHKLSIRPYRKEQEQKAINDYSELEKRQSGRKDYDVVLVGVDKANDLQKAYPNYFVDSTEFLSHLQKIINSINKFNGKNNTPKT
jgi:ppGpp synthetase/RelA/SpoT-type nucleotidyltranferase